MIRKNLSKNVVMAVWFMGAIFATSCTSDHFFGIEEETDGMSYSILNKIAQSKEFMEFQKQYFLKTEILDNLDTIKKEIYGQVGDKIFYSIGQSFSLKEVFDARAKLVESYPEYEKTTYDEKNQILNIAIMNNKTLMDLAERSSHSKVNRTKSINQESYAVRYTKTKRGDYEWISSDDGGEWLVGGCYTWYTRDDWMEAVVKAIQKTIDTENECGGYVFYDGSGITHVDPNAQPSEMDFYFYTYADGSPEGILPFYDFHVHPIVGNLFPSDSDLVAWSRMPWSLHIIYDKSGNMEPYPSNDQPDYLMPVIDF